MNCRNCGNSNIEIFCSNCGQKKTKRLSLNKFKKDLLSELNYENILFKTIFKLITNPRQVITEYFYGKRKSYFNPIKLLFIVLSIITLLSINVNESIQEKPIVLQIMDNEYFKFFEFLVLVPSYSLFSYLFFKNYKYNFAEHLLINTYFYAITSLFFIPIYLLKLTDFISFNSGELTFFLGFVIMIWLYGNVFRKKYFFTALKTILIMLIGISISMLIIFLIIKSIQFFE